MSFLRFHWFDIGILLALCAGGFVIYTQPIGLALILWLNLIALFIHQFEEYRYPGYFPGMMNAVMFSSKQPDRYPLNAQTALIINVLVGWLTYFLAAVFNTRAIWLGIAVILVSLGNFIAHTFIFNIKGKTKYNPGMATSLVFFLPLTVIFFMLLIRTHAASPLAWVLGIVLGIVLNAIGILKLIDWMKDINTSHQFSARFLMPGKQNNQSIDEIHSS